MLSLVIFLPQANTTRPKQKPLLDVECPRCTQQLERRSTSGKTRRDGTPCSKLQFARGQLGARDGGAVLIPIVKVRQLPLMVHYRYQRLLLHKPPGCLVSGVRAPRPQQLQGARPSGAGKKAVGGGAPRRRARPPYQHQASPAVGASKTHDVRGASEGAVSSHAVAPGGKGRHRRLQQLDAHAHTYLSSSVPGNLHNEVHSKTHSGVVVSLGLRNAVQA